MKIPHLGLHLPGHGQKPTREIDASQIEGASAGTSQDAAAAGEPTSGTEAQASPTADQVVPTDPAATPPIQFRVDNSGPHPRIIIPHGEPHNTRPVTSSHKANMFVGGTIAGGIGGGYIAMLLLSASPVAAVSVAVGSALLGGLAGYFAASPQQKA